MRPKSRAQPDIAKDRAIKRRQWREAEEDHQACAKFERECQGSVESFPQPGTKQLAVMIRDKTLKHIHKHWVGASSVNSKIALYEYTTLEHQVLSLALLGLDGNSPLGQTIIAATSSPH